MVLQQETHTIPICKGMWAGAGGTLLFIHHYFNILWEWPVFGVPTPNLQNSGGGGGGGGGEKGADLLHVPEYMDSNNAIIHYV